MNENTLLLWMDTETTGLTPETSALLEIGLQWTDTDLNPLDDGFDTPIHYVGPVDGFIRNMHGPNGLLAECALEDTPDLADAERRALDYIRSRMADDTRVLAAGSTVRFDRNMLDHHMPGLLDGISHRSLDVSTLLEAIRMWNPESARWLPEKTTDHRVRDCLNDSMNLARFAKGLIHD